MGKGVALLVAALGLSGIFYANNARQSSRDTGQKVATHQYGILAREAALTGYNRAKQALSEGDLNDITGSYERGNYGVQFVNNGSLTKITSIGYMLDGRGETVTYQISAEYKLVTGAMSETAPPHMNYALLTEEDLNINGAFVTEVLVTGEAGAELNANMHTNGNLHIDGNKASVEGFGTYVGSGSSNPNKALQGTFEPNYNPTSLDGAYQAGRVDIPVFDSALYTSEVAVDATTVGDVILSGDYDLGGTREDPYIWHVTGNVSSTGGTTLDGYVMFIVDGEVSLTGNVEMGDPGYSGPDESSVAFYAGGDVELGGNSEIYGQIYTSGDVLLHGTPEVYGSITTSGTATLSGTPDIYFRESSPALTTIWQSTEDSYRLVAYNEL
ncbi:MAG: hypothetical protein HKN43_08710 [Rhodothermales bacterium]|nr:hypothetical protein [Rhodothermales bacterium]